MSSLVDYVNLYNTDETVKEYVDKFSKKHRILPENACKVLMVQQYIDNYISSNNTDNPVINYSTSSNLIKCGC